MMNQSQNIHLSDGILSKYVTPEQKQEIIKEILEDRVPLSDVARKWGFSPDSVQSWVTDHQILDVGSWLDQVIAPSNRARGWYDALPQDQKLSMLKDGINRNISTKELKTKYSIPYNNTANRIHHWIQMKFANPQYEAYNSSQDSTPNTLKIRIRNLNFLGHLFMVSISDENSQWYDSISEEQKHSMVKQVID